MHAIAPGVSEMPNVDKMERRGIAFKIKHKKEKKIQKRINESPEILQNITYANKAKLTFYICKDSVCLPTKCQ